MSEDVSDEEGQEVDGEASDEEMEMVASESDDGKYFTELALYMIPGRI
jgi:hypothetical protein